MPPGLIAALAALALVAACSGPFETSKVRMLQLVNARKEARGAWITVRDRRQKPPHEVAGELLAASADSIQLLAEGRVTTLPTGDLRKVVLALYEAPSQEAGMPVLTIQGDARGRWQALVPHARFPQGLPRDFGRDSTTTR